ncbi:MAG: MutS-related protein [Pseudobacter sp.]|uniref:MutS-related protein n=1 Tax=Pseudobacter sp. TaxID=2045420 RepID=UPI003F80D48B
MFTTDKQTTDDLNIFGKHGGEAVFQIFNRCATRGGAMILEEWFSYPLSDVATINQRSNVIRYFAESSTPFPFHSAIFDAIEPWLANKDERTKLQAGEQSVTRKLSTLIAVDTETAIIYNGVNALVELLQSARAFVHSIDKPHPYAAEVDAIRGIVFDRAFERLPGSKGKLSHLVMAELDVLFRFRNRELIKKLLLYIYQLDVYISIARVAKERGFVFPEALPEERHILELEGVYHPQVKNAVANDITITPESNLIFLTGANMAGKSTFMKSLSIAMFLAHMGLPVPAIRMRFSVLDGIYTTINLPDNLGMGASHFYAEVLRVKKMTAELQQGKNLFIVFDELFRGTNVKDAFEATIAIAKSFAANRNSLFLISTHIIEAGEELSAACSNVQFIYLPTEMKDFHPVYTYKLKKGITDDRHGMMIVNNEGVLDILATGTAAQETVTGFIADKQTLDDLNLLGKFKPYSVYSLFNKVKTAGGERLLEELFRHPLTDADAINRRSGWFRYFQELQIAFPFTQQSFSVVDNYLGSATSDSIVGVIRKKLKGQFLRDEAYQELQAGLIATIDALNALQELLEKIDIEWVKDAKRILNDNRLSWLKEERGAVELSLIKTIKYDRLLRYTMRKEIAYLLKSLYELDVYIAVSDRAREKGFSYAMALPASENCLRASAIWHPGIDNAVPNPASLHQQSNVLFLTGANMAGKSTFMKSFGIVIYMAHMGFPVAARDLVFSVRDGLYSSINVADNLNMGYSHFYAEVLRVKRVAEQVSAGRNLVVIFDELFKGTNVKDAYDATLQVTESFSKYQNCVFIISTHIIEVGEVLRKEASQVQFAYLPTIMEGVIPRYTYQLTEGITSDRHGMVIIRNEGIV